MTRYWLIAALSTALATTLVAQEPQTKPKDGKTPSAKDKTATTKEKAKAKPAAEQLPPKAADFAYGSHPRQKFDFWQANSDKPTPVVLFIHGGGWNAGDKSTASVPTIKYYLENGISVAAINYRFIQQAMDEKVEPPVKAPLHDAARALQTIRSKAKEWNIDKTRIASTGGSAGACTSLWLAFHDDLADPKSSDPIARESSRLTCAAVSGAQTSLDPKQVREWIPNARYGGHAFGFKGQPNEFETALSNREKILPWIREYSPVELVSKDDPPIFIDYAAQDKPPVVGEQQKDPTHSAIYGIKLEEKLKDAGVECVITWPGHASEKYKTAREFVVSKLKAK